MFWHTRDAWVDHKKAMRQASRWSWQHVHTNMYWCLRWSSFLHASWSSFDGTIIVSSIIQETKLEDYYQTSWGPQSLILFIFWVYHIYPYNQYTKIYTFKGGFGGQKSLILKNTNTCLRTTALRTLIKPWFLSADLYWLTISFKKRNKPIGSMYGVFTFIQVTFMVSKYG